jgi:hypothetical protein
VRPRLIVPGDPAATAANILSHLPQYRAALAADLASTALFLIVTFLLYDLLRPVNPVVAVIAAPFSVTGCILQSALCFFHLAPLVLLKPKLRIALRSSSVAGPGSGVPHARHPRDERLHDLLRLLQLIYRVPHLPLDIPAENRRRAALIRWRLLSDRLLHLVCQPRWANDCCGI